MHIGRQCLNNYVLPIHPEWSDLEGGKDQQKEKEQEKEEEDWDGARQKQKEKELTGDKIPKADPDTMSPLENSDTKEDTPQLTDTLVGTLPILPPGEESK